MTLQTTIPVAFVKAFQKKARHIKSSKALPICDYLLFGWGEEMDTTQEPDETNNNGLIRHLSLKKTSIGAYCEVTTGECTNFMLLEEAEIYAFANATKAEHIKISQLPLPKADEKHLQQYRIELSDGKYKNNFQVDDISTFPAMPIPVGEPYALDSGAIEAIQSAAVFIEADADPNIRAWLKHVHLTEWGIYGTDSKRLYENKSRQCPYYALPIDAVQCMAGMHECILSQADNYIFLASGETKYGFKKMDGHRINGWLGQQIPRPDNSPYAFGTWCKIDKETVLGALGMLPPRNSNNEFSSVRIDFYSGIFTMEYNDNNLAKSKQTRSNNAEHTGSISGANINAAHLADALRMINTDIVQVFKKEVEIAGYNTPQALYYFLFADGDECVYNPGIFINKGAK